ncbi:MAG TPA: glycosyltransferase family 2 protein [Microthrixaceae bacterium]|nr:glycosyltransferase family 2 protein [Microthrixaceae bacterium]
MRAPSGEATHCHRSGQRLTTSVIIPTFNESKNIGWVLRRLPPVDEILVVDRCSPDRTGEIAKALHNRVRVINEPRRGKGTALRTGFDAAACDVVVMVDADGSMDPAEIPLYVDGIAQGYDFVKGSRFMAGGGSDDITPTRALGNHVLTRTTNLLFMSRFTDLCYGFMAFRRSALPDLRLSSTGFEIETEIVVNAVMANLRILEVPTHERQRRFGESNLRAIRDGQRVLSTILRERFGTWNHDELTLVKGRSSAATATNPHDIEDEEVIDLRADSLLSTAHEPSAP